MRAPYRPVLLEMPSDLRIDPVSGTLAPSAMRALVDLVGRLATKVNGGVSLGGDVAGGRWAGNLDGQVFDLDAPADVDTEFPLYHDLGRVPAGYLVLGQDAAGSLYTSRRDAWTERAAYFRANVAGVTFRVVIL